jgi:hypothetical protein
MGSRNSPEIPPKFSVRAGDLLLICALCHTNFAERRGVPLATRRRLASMPAQCDPLEARSARASTRSFVSTPSVNAA